MRCERQRHERISDRPRSRIAAHTRAAIAITKHSTQQELDGAREKILRVDSVRFAYLHGARRVQSGSSRHSGIRVGVDASL